MHLRCTHAPPRRPARGRRIAYGCGPDQRAFFLGDAEGDDEAAARGDADIGASHTDHGACFNEAEAASASA